LGETSSKLKTIGQKDPDVQSEGKKASIREADFNSFSFKPRGGTGGGGGGGGVRVGGGGGLRVVPAKRDFILTTKKGKNNGHPLFRVDQSQWRRSRQGESFKKIFVGHRQIPEGRERANQFPPSRGMYKILKMLKQRTGDFRHFEGFVKTECAWGVHPIGGKNDPDPPKKGQHSQQNNNLTSDRKVI